jgi:hypothetical protein
VAKPFGMRQHRHACLALHAFDQRLAATRHDQVEQPRRGQHRRNISPIGIRDDLHAGFRQSHTAQPCHESGIDRRSAVHALRSAAQDHCIARFQADATSIRANIRSALIYHADDADGRGDALDPQAIGLHPVRQRAPKRIGQFGDVLQSFCYAVDACVVQCEPIAEGSGPRAGRKVSGIGGQYFGRMRSQRRSHRAQSGIAFRIRRACQDMRRSASRFSGPLQILGGLGLNVHAQHIGTHCTGLQQPPLTRPPATPVPLRSPSPPVDAGV